MKQAICIGLYLWSLLACNLPVMAEGDNLTFKLNVVQSNYLPPEMYGTWSIEATIVKSNVPPWLYNPRSNELWALEQQNNQVTLKNIVTDATAMIHVDKVVDNTATFHHIAEKPKLRIVETPTLTVDGDKIHGVNRQELYFLKHDQVAKHYSMVIEIKGTRLSNGKTDFKNPFQYDPGFGFEVAPVQFVDDEEDDF